MKIESSPAPQLWSVDGVEHGSAVVVAARRVRANRRRIFGRRRAASINVQNCLDGFWPQRPGVGITSTPLKGVDVTPVDVAGWRAEAWT